MELCEQGDLRDFLPDYTTKELATYSYRGHWLCLQYPGIDRELVPDDAVRAILLSGFARPSLVPHAWKLWQEPECGSAS